MRRERGPYRYRRLQLLDGAPADAYRDARKPGAVLCPQCGAVFRRGRWKWGAPPAAVARRTCPACKRIKDRFPAGFVTLAGSFYRPHRDEILARLRHAEAREKAAHPLERIMNVAERDGEATVTTTSPHLARVLAHALKQAFKGRLSMIYNRHDSLLRVRWLRDD